MDKKLIMALVLSMGLIILYPYLMQWLYPNQKAGAPKTTPPAAITTAPQPQVTVPGAPSQATTPRQPQIKEELITVETPDYKAMISTVGGGVRGWELKKYKETLNGDSKGVNVASIVGIANSLRTQVTYNGFVEEVAFVPSTRAITLSSENDTAQLLLTGAANNGLKIEKKYTFSGKGYTVDTEIKVTNTSTQPFTGKVETVLSASVAGEDEAKYHQGPVVKTKDKLIRQPLKEPKASGTDMKWLGLESKYFLCAIILKDGPQAAWSTEVPSATSSIARVELPVSLNPGTASVYSYISYMGPKEYDLLSRQKAGLEEAVEFGWFASLARPLLVVLNFFEKYLHNYGLAIILLTVIIKVLFYPLTKHSLKSMKEMQKMQPQIAAIKERYKDNKEKLNKEMMELYKRYKINPVSGCLPIVLQIPVFIALYEVLYVAIELRHAPLFLWIRDLADKDPYYITPILMGATMFIQQKMTPTSMDPAQARIMMLMPIVFTFLFLNFPAGLVIYWLVNNVLTIAQQYYIHKAKA